MKAVYETLEQGMTRLIKQAERENRVIAVIELTVAEANEFRRAFNSKTGRYFFDMLPRQRFETYTAEDRGTAIGNYMGVELRIAP